MWCLVDYFKLEGIGDLFYKWDGGGFDKVSYDLGIGIIFIKVVFFKLGMI